VSTLGLFAPAVLGRRVFFQRDILSYWYPHLENIVRAVAEGGWPVWTPFVALGRPLLADPSLQLLYPPTWLNLVMPPAAYYTVFAVGHVWAAGFGLYRLGRTAGLSAAAAALAGAAWMMSGPLLSAVNLFHHFAGAAWMPWTLLMLARALAHPGPMPALALGAVAGGQALAGSADMCVMTALAGALLAADSVRQGPGTLRERLRSVGRVAVPAIAFAALLAAVQWLPALRLLLLSGARASQRFSVITTWSVHPASLVDTLVPMLVADLPLRPELRALLFDGRRPFLLSLYLGIGTVPLVALALAGPAHALRRWALAGLLLFLWVALGRHLPGAGALFAVPPLSVLRYPAKYMLPAALCWSLLAGRGLQVFMETWTAASRRRAAWIVAGSVLIALVLAGAALYLRFGSSPSLDVMVARGGDVWHVAAGRLAWAAATLAGVGLLLRMRRRREGGALPLAAACGLLVAADLFAAGRGVNALADPTLVRYRPPVAARISADVEWPRLYVRQESSDQLNEWLVRAGGWDSEQAWMVGLHDLLVPPGGARWRIGGSYDGDFTGLGQPGLGLFSLILPALGGDPTALKLLRIAAVTHVTSLREAPVPGVEPAGVFSSVFSRPVRLFRVPDPLPRLYVVGAARRAATENIALAEMSDPHFDPRREVILPDRAAVQAGTADFRGRAALTARAMDRLAVDVELSAPGWLVVVEAWDPGWRAQVDGRASEVLPANVLFRAVALPAGRHQVEMRYHPPGLGAGLLLSASAAALGMAAVARAAARARTLNAGGARDSMPAV
jgi:hypothetical protein